MNPELCVLALGEHQMTDIQFQYQKSPYSKIPAPYIPLTLGDPFLEKTTEIMALFDTGYDGNMLISFEVFENLQLYRYQYPSDLRKIGELVTGEQLELITAEASVKLSGLDYEFIVEINAIEECKEPLLGREFLNSLISLLNGPKRTLSLTFSNKT